MQRLRTIVASATIAALAPLSVTALGTIAPAHAADPKVCTTGPVPTPETAPWHKFSQAKNPIPAAIRRFVSADDAARVALTALSPTANTTVQATASAAMMRLQTTLQMASMGMDADLMDSMYEVMAMMAVVDPEAEPSPEFLEFATLMNGMSQVAEDLGASSGAHLDRVEEFFENQTSEFPIPGATYPARTLPIAMFGEFSDAFDRLIAAAARNVKWQAKPATTCVTTVSLKVPSASTKFGAKRSVTVSASLGGKAMKGNLIVLVDGKQVASAVQASSYAVALPTNLAAGRHVLTVAFNPADGGPLAARTSTITVTKAKTTTKVKLSKKAIKRGASATAKITVAVPGSTATATGKVKILVGKKSFNGTLRKGVATVKLKSLPAGKHKVKATYAGGASLIRSTGTATLTVR